MYARKIHPSFVRPYSIEDVCETLSEVPDEFLQGLKSIYLLGGSRKQEKVSQGNLFRYGCYEDCEIYLHSFPRSSLVERYTRPPSPALMQVYHRAGAEVTKVKRGWEVRFNLASLKRFYLRDVLVHELGHHVDRGNTHKSHAQAERYAEWFASEYGYRLPAINRRRAH